MGSLLLYTDAGFARHRGTGPWHGDGVCSEPSSSFCREGITTRFGSSSLRALDGLTGGQEGGLHPQVRRPGMDQLWARKATSTWSRARSCRRRPCRGVTPILASAQITRGGRIAWKTSPKYTFSAHSGSLCGKARVTNGTQAQRRPPRTPWGVSKQTLMRDLRLLRQWTLY